MYAQKVKHMDSQTHAHSHTYIKTYTEADTTTRTVGHTHALTV